MFDILYETGQVAQLLFDGHERRRWQVILAVFEGIRLDGPALSSAIGYSRLLEAVALVGIAVDAHFPKLDATTAPVTWVE